MFLEHNSNIMIEFQVLLCFENIMFLKHNVGLPRWKEICSTPLRNAIAMSIVEKYKDVPGDQLLPFTSSQNYNENIKTILEKAGITYLVTKLDSVTRTESKVPINEMASSHMARRTFIGNIYKLVKDPNLVSALTGHAEGSRAFNRYRDIDIDMKRDLVKILEGKH